MSPSAEEPSFEGQSQLFPGATASISMAETAGRPMSVVQSCSGVQCHVLHCCTGYGVSLTSVTNAAGPSSIGEWYLSLYRVTLLTTSPSLCVSSTESMAMRPRPLQTLETAAGNAGMP